MDYAGVVTGLGTPYVAAVVVAVTAKWWWLGPPVSRHRGHAGGDARHALTHTSEEVIA